MMGPRTAPGILPGELRQIELINHFNDKPSQVILRQPILNGRGKQEVSVPISKYKMSHHQSPVMARGLLIISLRYGLVKSDRLLDAGEGRRSPSH